MTDPYPDARSPSSPFGLRAGADVYVSKSKTCARLCIVNDGDRSGIESSQTVAQGRILLYHEASR
jgi:hypothetical protein